MPLISLDCHSSAEDLLLEEELETAAVTEDSAAIADRDIEGSSFEETALLNRAIGKANEKLRSKKLFCR